MLKLPVEQIYAGEETRARNQRIQNMFRMIGFGENLGSGFPLILNAWNEKHWLKPQLIEQRDLLQVKLILSIETKDVVKVGPMEKNDPKDDLKEVLKEVSDRQDIIMLLIKANDLITIQEMSQKIKASEKTVKRELAVLQEKGVLTREGGRKNGKWIIKD